MITKLSGNGLFFTSDSHFNHKAIIDLCNRPFSSVEEHDRKLIDNWNSVVSPGDTVFHLGDFCFAGYPKWKEIRNQLNGNIILIIGNHDRKNLTAQAIQLFDEVLPQAQLQIDGRTVYLNHFPFLCFAHADPGVYKDTYSIQLFGHIHSGPKSTSNDVLRTNVLYPTQYDVGVDNNNYTPISWSDVINKINLQINQCIK